MPKKTEAQAVEAVVDRLAERFPAVERSVIEDMVAHEHSLFVHGRVRDYIPILVERAAKLRLSGRPAQPAGPAQPLPAPRSLSGLRSMPLPGPCNWPEPLVLPAGLLEPLDEPAGLPGDTQKAPSE